jgi:hypothetical protein
MLVPFGELDWEVAFYHLSPRLTLDVSSIDSLVREPEVTVVLAPEYFGSRLNPLTHAALCHLRRNGCRIIEDWTHSVLANEREPIDLAFASLRKTLPVGDGSLVWGMHAQLEPTSGPGLLMWEAMDLLALGCDPATLDAARVAARAAEDAFFVELEPARMSDRTEFALAVMPWAFMIGARRKNARVLADEISSFPVVNGENGPDVPSHLVIQASDPVTLQRRLAERGIFCPIHWPRPPQLPVHIEFRKDLLSIPIDHRYNADDMRFVANAVNACHE